MVDSNDIDHHSNHDTAMMLIHHIIGGARTRGHLPRRPDGRRAGGRTSC